MNSTLEPQLRKHGLRVTTVRLDVLNALNRRSFAISQPELEIDLGRNCDRVTLYRTLNTLCEHGLLHRIVDDKGTSRYALCRDNCEATEWHFHSHLHFFCESCKETRCLNETEIVIPPLSDGFEIHNVQFSASGLCGTCKQSSNIQKPRT